MSNPKAARISRTMNEQTSARDTMQRRLRALGATPEEVDMAMANWDSLDEDWSEEARYAFAHISDARLRDALQQVRAEYPFEEERRGALVEGDPSAVAVGAFGNAETPPARLPEGAPAVNAPIAALEEWVGDDRERARLVIDAETLDCQLRSQTPRKTLLAKMQAVVDE